MVLFDGCSEDLIFFVFDVLFLVGEDLCDLLLIECKVCFKVVLVKVGKGFVCYICFVDYFEMVGDVVL